MKFKDRLKAIRAEQQVDQETLGDRCRLSATTLSHYETGRREPTLKNIIKLKRGLGISYSHLLDRVTT